MGKSVGRSVEKSVEKSEILSPETLLFSCMGVVVGELVVGELVVDVISFQKIFGLCGLKCHIV